MSEELNKIQEVENEKYQYIPEEGEQLITDKPSEPLKVKGKQSKKVAEKEEPTEPIEVSLETRIETTKVEIVEITTLPKKDLIREVRVEKMIKSNKELYESYIKDLKNFSLIINGEVIYDSSIDKFKEYPVKFENDYFVLYGRKYSYNGLKIQKINMR